MKRLNDNKMRLVVVGCVAAVLFGGGGNAKADDTWLRKSDMPTTRYSFSTSVVGDKIYAFGGDSRLTRVDEYEPATDTWTQKADMPTARDFPSTCVVNEKVYVIGGGSVGMPPVFEVEVYDPATDTWAEQTELPTRRMWFSSNVVDGTIYTIGGTDGLGKWEHFGTVEAYNPDTDTWRPKADMPTGRSLLSTCVLDGIIYAIGGWPNGATQAVEAYDPLTDTWTRKAPMPTARYLLGTSVVGGKIYAIGGWKHSAEGPLYSAVEVYDPSTDAWTIRPDMPVPTAGLSTSFVDGKIYAIGGALTTHNGTFVHTSAVYEYYTAPSPDSNGNGAVDIKDLIRLIESWGQNDPLVDVAPPFEDGVVDILDLECLMSYWGQTVDDPKLIAHWPLDETEGMFVADRAGDSNGYALGDPVWKPEGGQVNGALQLDGVDDYVVTGAAPNPGEGPISVLAWIKGGAPDQVVLSQMGKANWLGTDPSTGALMTELTASGQNGSPLGSDAIITDGNWHRIGYVWDGSYRRLYVDSVVVVEDSQEDLDISSNGLYFGTGKTMEPGTFFSGLIDDIRIYNRVISP